MLGLSLCAELLADTIVPTCRPEVPVNISDSSKRCLDSSMLF